MDIWPFFLLEENIKIVNEISEEEDKERKKQETETTSNTNFNPGSYMKDFKSMSNNFKTPKF